jgi:hypothetical protein
MVGKFASITAGMADRCVFVAFLSVIPAGNLLFLSSCHPAESPQADSLRE